MSAEKRVRDRQIKLPHAISANAGDWSLRLQLLSKRLRGRPVPVVEMALHNLMAQENRAESDEWITSTASRISQGRYIHE